MTPRRFAYTVATLTCIGLLAHGAHGGNDSPAGGHNPSPDDGQSVAEDRGLQPDITPPQARVPVGMSRQFTALRTGGMDTRWGIVASSVDGDEDSDDVVGTIDDNGLFIAHSGGWVIIGLYEKNDDDDQNGELLAQTEKIWVMGGPTRVSPERGGRAFCAENPLAEVQFPAQAHQRAMTVLLEKRGQEDLPEQARGLGIAISVFEFTATEAESGIDVGGGDGFSQPAQLTLPFDEDALPPGIRKIDLIVGSLDEVEVRWRIVPPADVLEVDTENNTITVLTTHASYWAVLAGESLDDTPTPVEHSSWGRIKRAVE